MQIITGKTGTNHVTAEDDRALHAGAFGAGAYILNVGSKLEAAVKSANEIELSDGELMLQGIHARIRYGETESVTIDNGTTGYNRIDLIVARYTKVADVEKVELSVVKGDSTPGESVSPQYISGNVLEGAELAEFPIYTITLSGVNIASVVKCIPESTGLDNVYRKNEVYSKNEAYSKDEVYNKNETYNRSEINTSLGEINTRLATVANTANTANSTANTANSTANSTSETMKYNKARFTKTASDLHVGIQQIRASTSLEQVKDACQKVLADLALNLEELL